jgi:MFS family permease
MNSVHTSPVAAAMPRAASAPQAVLRLGECRGSARLLVFIATAMLVAFATNLAMHLLNLRMQRLGVSDFFIGLSVACQAMGIVLTAPLTKSVIAALGVRRTFVLGAAVATVALVAFGSVSAPFAMAMLRMLLAVGLALMFVVSETLVIASTDEHNRGSLIGWYATGLAVGTSAGSAFVAVCGIEGLAPLLWGAFFFWVATIPVLAFIDGRQGASPAVRGSSFAALRLMPVAFLTAFVFGMVDNGGLSMLSVYSTSSGLDYGQAAMLVAVATLGGIALQVPLGYAASKWECRLVLLLCTVGAIALVALLPTAMRAYASALGVSFVLGGVLEGFYTIGLICIAKQCRSIGISTANGCFISLCGFGELVGPLMTGSSIQYLGSYGFIVGLTVLLAIYAAAIGCIREQAVPDAAYSR